MQATAITRWGQMASGEETVKSNQEATGGGDGGGDDGGGSGNGHAFGYLGLRCKHYMHAINIYSRVI